MNTNPALPTVREVKRMPSPAPAPQALAFHAGKLWMGSRDLSRIYVLDPERSTLLEEMESPGKPWAAVFAGDGLWFTIGEGENDDRYIRRYVPGSGFTETDRIACPEFTGSYLSHDGEHLYLSQWYKHRILQLDASGEIRRTIDVGAEICGHTFVDGTLYVLRGTEQDGERWTIARVEMGQGNGAVEDIARVPFASRSLTHDGQRFWSNHRAAAEIVAFELPE